MSEQVNLSKRVYSKLQYPRVISTEFTQLIPVDTNTALADTIVLPTISEFFTYYETLFLDIPKTGSTNSHEYLVQRSGDYVGQDTTNTEIQALLQEITQLRTENLELLKQINNLTTNG